MFFFFLLEAEVVRFLFGVGANKSAMTTPVQVPV